MRPATRAQLVIWVGFAVVQAIIWITYALVPSVGVSLAINTAAIAAYLAATFWAVRSL